MPSIPYAVLLALGQWIVGYLLKRWPQFPNQFIPVATFLLALFGYSVSPAHAGTLADVLGGPGGIFLSALVQNLLVTGAHSTWKNTVLPSLLSVLKLFTTPK